MTSILIIPDAHAKPNVSNERFSWLGKLIVTRQPDVVVNIGDLADMESLSSYDVGKKNYEGRRYIKDCESVHDALRRIQQPIDEYNRIQRNNKKKQYLPKKYITEGNHEHRIYKVVNSDPKLDGTISIKDLKFEEYGWEVTPFLKTLFVEGIGFQHYATSGPMDRPMSGENLGMLILKRYHHSLWVGHSHLLRIANDTTVDGKIMFAGSTGCYFEHLDSYVSESAQSKYWRGLVYLKNVKDGYCKDIELISMDSIKRKYA